MTHCPLSTKKQIHPRLGAIAFTRNVRARRITVHIQADGLRVTLPPGVTEQEALRFVGEHEDAPNLRARREREAHALHALDLSEGVEVRYHERRSGVTRPPKPKAPPVVKEAEASAPALKAVPLETVLGKLAESFSQRLLRLIRERGLTDVEAYRRANVSRKVFSKIRSNKDYHPSRATACAFVIALGLSADEARALLLSAGLALSNASKFDLIVQYFVERGETDVLKVNEALFSFGQPLLGGA